MKSNELTRIILWESRLWILVKSGAICGLSLVNLIVRDIVTHLLFRGTYCLCSLKDKVK